MDKRTIKQYEETNEQLTKGVYNLESLLKDIEYELKDLDNRLHASCRAYWDALDQLPLTDKPDATQLENVQKQREAFNEELLYFHKRAKSEIERYNHKLDYLRENVNYGQQLENRNLFRMLQIRMTIAFFFFFSLLISLGIFALFAAVQLNETVGGDRTELSINLLMNLSTELIGAGLVFLIIEIGISRSETLRKYLDIYRKDSPEQITLKLLSLKNSLGEQLERVPSQLSDLDQQKRILIEFYEFTAQQHAKLQVEMNTRFEALQNHWMQPASNVDSAVSDAEDTT